MKITISIFLGILLTLAGRAQESGFELLQILKLSERYKLTPNLNYTTNFTYADSTNPSNILEQITGVTRISEGKYWSFLDSVELIQGQQYNLAVYYNDSTIIINDKKEYGDILKLSFLDSVFRMAHVDTMSITTQNDSTRIIQVLFNAGTPYSKYVVNYNPLNYLVREIKYFMKDDTDPTGIPSGVAVFTVSFSDYSVTPVDQSIFREDKFIYKQNGQFQKKPAFADFTLINNSIN